MDTKTVAKTRRAQRRDDDVINTSQPSRKATRKFALPRPTRIIPDYVRATRGVKSGYETFELERGDVTYRALTFGIKSAASIAGITTATGGIHMIKVEHLSTYLGEARVVANGTQMQALHVSELITRNAFHGNTFGPVFTGFAYPGENMYWDRGLVDAYALGTMGMKSLSLEIKLEAAFDNDTMELIVMPHAVDIARGPGFTFTTERLNTVWTGAGKHTYMQLPIAEDIKDVWIMADGIERVKMTVDSDILFDMSRFEYEAFLTTNGRDVSVLGGQWFLDFHIEGDARSLAALDRPAELRRDARVKLEVVTSDPVNTPVEFLITHAGIYNKIR